jgi:hypothetical protein
MTTPDKPEQHPEQRAVPEHQRRDPERVQQAHEAEKQRSDDLLDEAVEETFPASDPIAPHASREHAERAEHIVRRGEVPAKPTPTTKPDKPQH